MSKQYKTGLKELKAEIVEFADDNGLDVEVTASKIICYKNGTQKAFESVSAFIRAMFSPQAQEIAFKEWSLHFDRAMFIMWADLKQVKSVAVDFVQELAKYVGDGVKHLFDHSPQLQKVQYIDGDFYIEGELVDDVEWLHSEIIA